MTTYTIHISGLVQGVGFRPFIYKLASGLKIKGEVENRNDGVYIRVNTEKEDLDLFLTEIRAKAPPASRIDTIEYRPAGEKCFDNFSIKTSENISHEITGVSPDIAVCDDCLQDMKTQAHRKNYPLINCTNCGPRFTIIRDIPYDRPMTTMSGFEMCEQCRAEYSDVKDRRFHAQPVACNNCGPEYVMDHENTRISDINEIVLKAATLIDSAKIAAIKGLGGFHLVCDANNEEAVSELRKRKQRDGKPFAVMCSDMEVAQQVGYIEEEGRKCLNSWSAPVVIVRSKDRLAPQISDGLDTVGIILPYMPMYYLLFEKLKTDVLVFTSANLSDEPVIIDNEQAVTKLEGIADFFIHYNRNIHNRVDDSVVKMIDKKAVVIRRSRGYTPLPLQTKFNTEGIFACGAELLNCFAIGKGKDVILSQYIGDLKNSPAYDFYQQSYKLMSRLFKFSPELIIKDLHPDYLSSAFAYELSAETGAEVISVQHHHAHLASCMAEHQLDEPVIGLSLDGVGLGDDGKIWGGEIMIADYSTYKRRLHFDYVPVMGADRVSEEPWRSGLSYLQKYLPEGDSIYDIPFVGKLKKENTDLYLQGLAKRINTHEYSSAGRLFDAVAAICGINSYAGFHAEAPMRLESVIDKGYTGSYEFEIRRDIISFAQAIIQISRDVLDGRDIGYISSCFHNTIINALAEAVRLLSSETGIRKIALSGGTFQNACLVTGLSKSLSKKFEVYLHKEVPPNDGGLALGQLLIGAQKR